jgi:hypothetical protein
VKAALDVVEPLHPRLDDLDIGWLCLLGGHATSYAHRAHPGDDAE